MLFEGSNRYYDQALCTGLNVTDEDIDALCKAMKEQAVRNARQVAVYDNRLEITSPGKLPIGQTMDRMKEGYSKIRNEALAHAFAYMNLIEHWGSGIPRIIDKVKAAELREPEFIGGEVDLRINIYRGQVDGTVDLNDLNDLNNAIKVPDTIDKMPNSGNIHYTK